jgi:hypothetical protein
VEYGVRVCDYFPVMFGISVGNDVSDVGDFQVVI